MLLNLSNLNALAINFPRSHFADVLVSAEGIDLGSTKALWFFSLSSSL